MVRIRLPYYQPRTLKIRRFWESIWCSRDVKERTLDDLRLVFYEDLQKRKHLVIYHTTEQLEGMPDFAYKSHIVG